ncbi:hypothetical protein ZIOFF_031637 [Zingiber officinale]|uniref:argininosuccinate synthase n=1 Tax=Zingiber officinale TaxID=94328 RepID=A0A8J5L0G3_ZINOF|nr:hypothetical protein ZIOFF_031637 [Zingiber officinale]
MYLWCSSNFIFRYLEIGIESGLPVSINGRKLSPASLLSELNKVGGKHGIGRIDMVENRLVGMKSRGVYETPGGTILWAAARELESLTLDRETIQMKDLLALKYAELVYAGRWFDPLRYAMDAFMERITETTTGSVTLKLYKGLHRGKARIACTGRTSLLSRLEQSTTRQMLLGSFVSMDFLLGCGQCSRRAYDVFISSAGRK